MMHKKSSWSVVVTLFLWKMNTDAYYFINMNVFSLIHNTVMQDSQSAG